MFPRRPAPIPPLLPHVQFSLAADLPKDYLFFLHGRHALAFLTQRILEKQENPLFLVPAYTCESVVHAIVGSGGNIHFVDLDESLDFSLEDLDDAASRNRDRPLVLVATSQFGAPIRNYKEFGPNWTVIEDRAQATPHNSSADYQILSFGPGKLISGFGGGALRGATVDSWLDLHTGLTKRGSLMLSMLLAWSQMVTSKWAWPFVEPLLSLRSTPSSSPTLEAPLSRLHPVALDNRRARWISHSLHHVDLSPRVSLSATYTKTLPKDYRFNIPGAYPYLRYPVRPKIVGPGVTHGDMYSATWRLAEVQRGKCLPGARALIHASFLPMHTLVTHSHVQYYRDLLLGSQPS